MIRSRMIRSRLALASLLLAVAVGCLRPADPPPPTDPPWFEDVTEKLGLDFVVVNHLAYDPAKRGTGRGGQRDFCGPEAFHGVVARLYRNLTGLGKGARFQDVTQAAGLGNTKAKGLGVFCADFNRDGWP